MTTNKSPVYHRTPDGRKVVIVGFADNGLNCVDALYRYKHDTFRPDELTPWVEPETKTVYVHGWKTVDGFSIL
jgi:hypothetical protein